MTSSTTTEPPVGTPVYGAGVWQSFRRFWKGYVVFGGRASRSEYWWATLVMGIISLVVSTIVTVLMVVAVFVPLAGTVGYAGTEDATWLINSLLASLGLVLLAMAPLLLFSLAIALPSYSSMARRLRDAGFSPWLVLLNLIGFGIVPLIMCALETKPEGGVQGYPQQGYAQQTFGSPAQG